MLNWNKLLQYLDGLTLSLFPFRSKGKIGAELLKTKGISKFTNEVSRRVAVLKIPLIHAPKTAETVRLMGALQSLRTGAALLTRGFNFLLYLELSYRMAVLQYCADSCCDSSKIGYRYPF